MPFLTADALTEDPEGLAFLRDVLAEPAADESAGKRPRRGPAIRRHSRRRAEPGKSEPKPRSGEAGEEPVEAAA